MKSRCSWFTPFALLCLLTLTSASARAQVPREGAAHALVDEGVALRREGHDAEAVVLFRRAFELDASGRTEAQLGLGLLAIGEFVNAYDHLEHALTLNDEWIERNRAAIQSSLQAASQHVGFVEVSGDDAGADVNVNGERVGQLPLAAPIRVQTGRAIIDVTMEGFRSFSADVSIQAGQTSRVSVHLVPNLAPDVFAGGDVTQQEWFWPLILGTAGAIVIAGVSIGIAAAVWDPPYEPGDVRINTLTVRP